MFYKCFTNVLHFIISYTSLASPNWLSYNVGVSFAFIF